jgi:phosphatidylserine/phosphatidylglycerophosphate/cardiolipin synthase-like enzyme
MGTLIARLLYHLDELTYSLLIELINSNKLNKNSKISTIAEYAKILKIKVSLLVELIRTWRNEPTIDTKLFLIMLEGAYLTKSQYLEVQPKIELSWNGPFSINSSVTKSIYPTMIEMISSAKREIMLVGYLLIPSSTQVIELVDRIKDKANQGCQVWIALNNAPNNRDNVKTLKDLWGDGPPFELYCWNVTEEKVSLHAKMLLVDEDDFLITSANLTGHGMSKNIEIGLRYSNGSVPLKMKHQFKSLVDGDILVKQ